MSKRIADDQLTRENFHELDGEDGIIGGNAKVASTEILSSRKILKPRGHLGNTGTNGFKGIKFPSATVPSSTPSNPFSNFQTPSPVSSASSKDDDRNNKIKALNIKLLESLKEKHTANTIVNFTPILNKYIEYYQQIEKESESTTTTTNTKQSETSSIPTTSINFSLPPTSNGSTTSASNPEPTQKQDASMDSSDSESDSESDDEDDKPKDIKIQGPQFTLESKPTVKRSPFTFGPKVEKPKDDSDSDSDSESEIEIKGPTFTFNKPIKDNVFKFDSASKEETPAAPKPLFSFQPPAATAVADKKEAAAAPAAAASEPAVPKPLFSFQPSTEKKEEAPKPFTFGSSVTTNNETTKPVFGFGSSTTTNNDSTSTPAPAPSFNFGASNGSQTKPAFSFGASTTSTEKKDEQPKSLFSFSNENKSTDAKPFSFGSIKAPTATFPAKEDKASDNGTSSDKPLPFSFNSSNEKTEAPKPFSFGASTTTTSAFSFNKSSSENKPAFSFGSSNSTTTDNNKPNSGLSFSFNSNNTSNENKPAFSFGSSNGTANGTGIGNGNGNGGSSLFGGNSFSFKPQEKKEDSVTATAGEEEDDKVEEVEVEGNFTPVASLASEKVESSTGEESEDTLYSQRAKLMIFNSENKENPYTNKGVGEFKILKNKDSGKSRILMRADGGLRVLFNAAISSKIVYSSLGDGSMIKIPNINGEGKLETYVVKVKKADDGKELLKCLNEAKQ
ncbi:uncharacterized protein RJT21DRAFT_89638 [Scheffersomyces amazonensis]|uniref:uncharacterized protein n=1 Tax=Scheffersomyces amazonensis TaxID=1078765 RepID=UPI00315D5396